MIKTFDTGILFCVCVPHRSPRANYGSRSITKPRPPTRALPQFLDWREENLSFEKKKVKEGNFSWEVDKTTNKFEA